MKQNFKRRQNNSCLFALIDREVLSLFTFPLLLSHFNYVYIYHIYYDIVILFYKTILKSAMSLLFDKEYFHLL